MRKLKALLGGAQSVHGCALLGDIAIDFEGADEGSGGVVAWRPAAADEYLAALTRGVGQFAAPLALAAEPLSYFLQRD